MSRRLVTLLSFSAIALSAVFRSEFGAWPPRGSGFHREFLPLSKGHSAEGWGDCWSKTDLRTPNRG